MMKYQEAIIIFAPFSKTGFFSLKGSNLNKPLIQNDINAEHFQQH